MKKTPEEIEELAREFATKPVNPLNPNGTITCLLSKNGYEKGYTQCQQDNAEKVNNQITDKEHKDLMKAIYPKDNSKRFRR